MRQQSVWCIYILYCALLLNILWQPQPLYIICVELKAEALTTWSSSRQTCKDLSNLKSKVLTQTVSARQNKWLLQFYLDKKVVVLSRDTYSHVPIQKSVSASLYVSCERIELEDNNGWHQRPVRPRTQFTISRECCEPQSNPWEWC